MGAWIETTRVRRPWSTTYVAPRVGAWIETAHDIFYLDDETVAPRVGAWIETAMVSAVQSDAQSHPVWVRGLKPAYIA